MLRHYEPMIPGAPRPSATWTARAISATWLHHVEVSPMKSVPVPPVGFITSED